MTDQNRQPEAGGAFPVLAPKKRFPGVGDLFAMLGIVLGMQVVAGVVLTVGFTLAGWVPGRLNPAQQGIFTALAYVLSMLPAYLAVIWYRRMRGGGGPLGRFAVRGLNPVLLLWAFVFMMAAGVVCEPLLSWLPAPDDLDYGTGLWAVLTLVVAAPVLEELLCRGLVLESLRTRFGVVAAWLLSSLFFGVLHLQPMLVVNAFIIGLILGYIYMVTDSGLDDSPCAQQRHRLSDDDERARRPAADRHDRQPDPLLEYLYRCGGRHPRFGLDGVADAAAAQGPGGKSGVGVINGAFRR